jgi:hypothetical protein
VAVADGGVGGVVPFHSRQEGDVVTAHRLSRSGIEQNQMTSSKKDRFCVQNCLSIEKGKTRQSDIVNLPGGAFSFP